jgi:hypothetical protein
VQTSPKLEEPKEVDITTECELRDGELTINGEFTICVFPEEEGLNGEDLIILNELV